MTIESGNSTQVIYERTITRCTYCGRPVCNCTAEDYAIYKEEIPMDPIQALLRQTADKFNKRGLEVKKLSYKGDDSGKIEALKERAKMIEGLPGDLEKIEAWQYFDEEVVLEVESMALEAREVIEEGRSFGLGVLLIPQGSRGDPNRLEDLIDQTFGPLE